MVMKGNGNPGYMSSASGKCPFNGLAVTDVRVSLVLLLLLHLKQNVLGVETS